MKSNKIFAFIIVWLLIFFKANAATFDSIVILKGVQITSTKSFFMLSGFDGTDARMTDSTTNFSLNSLLQKDNRFFIKNYGASGLASISFNGTQAAQNKLFWNGITLNSPANGQVDLNLINLAGINDYRLSQSGYNGTIGSSFFLESSIEKDKQISSINQLVVGSFGTVNFSSSTSYSHSFFAGKTAISFLNSTNNYSYKNQYLANSPTQKNTNASSQLYSIMQQLQFTIKKKHQLLFDFWYTDANRNIAPTLTQKESKQNQIDNSIKGILTYQVSKQNWAINFKSAIVADNFNYTDALLLLQSKINAVSIQHQINYTHLLPKKITINAQIAHNYEQVFTSNYSTKYSRNLTAARLSASYPFFKNNTIQVKLKQELNQNKFAPFAFQIIYKNDITKNRHHLNYEIDFARAYRIPAMNDLYWTNGGNPNLLSEKSFNGNISLKYSYSNFFSVSVNPFVIYANNWIQWIPTSSGFWQATNYKTVINRGVNASLKYDFAILTYNKNRGKNKIIFSNTLNLNYTKATALKTNTANDAAINKQLIYQPIWQLSYDAKLNYLGFYIGYRLRYTGKRYTTSDNSSSLEKYTLHDLEFGKEIKTKYASYLLSFQIKNIGNKQYETIALRPMAGRSFYGTIILTI